MLAPMPGFVDVRDERAACSGMRFVGVPLTPTSRSTSARCSRRSRSTARRSSTSPTRTTRPATCSTTRAIERDHRGGAGAGRDRRGLPAVRRQRRHGRAGASSRTARDAHAVASSAWPGVRLGYLSGAAALDRRDRQGAPALQRQRAERRGGAVRAASTPTCSRARPPRSARERARLQRALAALPGVTRVPERGQHHPVARAAMRTRAFDGMKARGVLVKNVRRLHPLLANCLRLTVGTPDENDAMLAALRATCESAAASNQHVRQRARRSHPQHRRKRRSRVALDLDGTGRAQLATGIGFFDHMLDQIARHGMIDLEIEAQGRPAHRRPPHGGGRRHHARPGGRARRSATRRACAATATPTCRSTRRCRAWSSISPAGPAST